MERKDKKNIKDEIPILLQLILILESQIQIQKYDGYGMSVVVPPPLGLLLSMVEQRQEAGGWDKVDTTRLRILQASSLSNVSLLIHLQAHNLTRHKYCQTKQPYTDFQAMCRPTPIQCHISTQEDIS